MSRRRLTIKRIDPWSVLKVGAVVNFCLWLVVLVGFGVLWFFVSQLGLIDELCEITTTTGADETLGLDGCAISGGGIFRSLAVLGFIGAIIQTGLFVVSAFLYNTISAIVGGLQFITEDGSSGTAVEPTISRGQPRRAATREGVDASGTRSGAGEQPPSAVGDGPVGEMRQRARELANRRKRENDEARQLKEARAAERARQAAAAADPAAEQPIRRRPEP